MSQKIAVLIPCYNEEMTIADVVRDFQRVLPDADVYVYDNNSTDRSFELAESAGATVRKSPVQGKGACVRQMFQEIEADCYLLVDADNTYPAESASALVEPVLAGMADMVCGDRLSTTYHQENQRPFHSFGNRLVCLLIRVLFHRKISDVMTGYRAFSRRFVKNCPILSNGFELETEMTLFALDRRLPVLELPVQYRDRPAGSYSKLHTFRDGIRVLKTIFLMLKDYHPLLTFGGLGVLMLLVALLFFIPVLQDFLSTGLVPRFPTLFCSIALGLFGVVLITCGLVLDTTKHYFDRIHEVNLLNSRPRSNGK